MAEPANETLKNSNQKNFVAFTDGNAQKQVNSSSFFDSWYKKNNADLVQIQNLGQTNLNFSSSRVTHKWFDNMPTFIFKK